MICPLCAAYARVLAHDDRSVTSQGQCVEAPSDLALCQYCGHVFTRAPKLSGQAFYEAEYDATLGANGFDELVSLSTGETVGRTDFDAAAVKRMLEPTSKRVLEIGAGHGRLSARLRRDGFDVWAFELSERYRANLTSAVGAAHTFIGTPPSGTFDAIVSFFMLEHDVDPLTTLRTWRTMLNPNGVLALAVPNPVTNLGDFACADHVNHFSPWFLGHLLACAGFTVETIDAETALGTTLVKARVSTAEPAPLGGGRWRERSAAFVEPFLALRAQLETLDAQLEGTAKTYLYGAGFYAALISARLRREISGIFDANTHKQGSLRLGHQVRAPDTMSPGPDDALVLCVSPRVASTLRAKFSPAFRRVVSLELNRPMA